MNLEEALAKDMALRQKLLAAIAGKYELEPKSLAKTDTCVLGNWLLGEAERKFPFVKSYQPCVDAHAAFHAELEKVARQINLGEYQQAEAMLAAGSDCFKAYVALANALKQFKTDAKL